MQCVLPLLVGSLDEEVARSFPQNMHLAGSLLILCFCFHYNFLQIYLKKLCSFLTGYVFNLCAVLWHSSRFRYCLFTPFSGWGRMSSGAVGCCLSKTLTATTEDKINWSWTGCWANSILFHSHIFKYVVQKSCLCLLFKMILRCWDTKGACKCAQSSWTSHLM